MLAPVAFDIDTVQVLVDGTLLVRVRFVAVLEQIATSEAATVGIVFTVTTLVALAVPQVFRHFARR